jgi:excisionase family DNA binding protein
MDSQFFDNQLINYEQAARYLSVSVPYLRKLKAKGKIPFVPMGRGVRFRVKSLNEWAERREIK